MKKTTLARLILWGLLIPALSAKLPAQLTLGAEIRPRAEYRHGFKELIDAESQDPAFFIEQRSRLTGHYRKAKLELMFSFQDLRIWGAEPQIYKTSAGSANNFAAVNQAWVAWHLNSRWTIKLGRQELDYDNARFLGSLDWAQQARSHDVLLFTFRDSLSDLHLGAAFNQDADTPEYAKLTGSYYAQPGNYKTIQYLWYHRRFSHAAVSGLFFNNGVQTVDGQGRGVVRFSQTLGINGNLTLGAFRLDGEAYYQFGQDRLGNKLRAVLLAAAISFPLSVKTSGTLGLDYLSGTELTAAPGINRSFEPLYGTNHQFYGFMDYFYVGNTSAQMGRVVGLINPHLKMKAALGKKINLSAHGHGFFSPVALYRDPEPVQDRVSSFLGLEADLVMSLNMGEDANLKLGYSQLFAAEGLEIIKRGNRKDTQNWAWLMVTFKPTLFRSDKE